MYDFDQQAEALRIAAQAIDMAQRGTGRTYRMIEQVRDGDAIICAKHEAGHIRHLIKERRIKADVRLMTALEFIQARDRVFRGQHRTHFTHEFIQQCIELEIVLAHKRLAAKMNDVNSVAVKKEADEVKRYMTEPCPILEAIPSRKSGRKRQLLTSHTILMAGSDRKSDIRC